MQPWILHTILVLCTVSATRGQPCTPERDVRVVGGQFYYGILEVCHQGQWIVACYNPPSLGVVCQQLGLAPPGTRQVPAANALRHPSSTTFDTFVRLLCNGHETHIEDCMVQDSSQSDGRCTNFLISCLPDISPCCAKNCPRNSDCIEGRDPTSLAQATCQCKPGFTGSETCRDIDECRNTRNCENGRCINTEGSFQCECDPGFKLGEDRRTCIDIDECELADTLCENGECDNTEGSFRCICDAGYIPSNDEKSCNDGCGGAQCENGECVNTEDSFYCECDTGYTPTEDGMSCIDVNECELDESPCENGECVNSVGGFRCVCGAGYKPSDDCRSCIDIDECELVDTLCENGECDNTEGSFRCVCDLGYRPTENGRSCRDINECQDEVESRCENGLCERKCENGWCINTAGSFRCQCDSGYKLGKYGKSCIDINECELVDILCENGECVNTEGGFHCECDTGYKPGEDGTSCEAADECKDGNMCPTGEECVKTYGGIYKCKPFKTGTHKHTSKGRTYSKSTRYSKT